MRNQDDAEQMEKHEAWQKALRRIGILLVLILLFLATARGANNRLDVTEYTYENDMIPLSFNGFRIVQLSDLHNHIFPENNDSLLQEVKALQPDLIVLTGDFIDASNHTNVDAALLFMAQIPQIAPTYYVYGNHEHYLDKSVLEPFQEKIAEYGVTLLYNECVQIESKTGQTFSLIGMDDHSLQANILKTLVEDAPDDFRVMLAHEPEYLHDYYAESGVDLVFSGHAHGGQFRIPFINQGIYAPDQGLFPKLTEGIHTDGDTSMIISRGLGNSAFPFRLFNHPEIICVTLKAAQGEIS